MHTLFFIIEIIAVIFIIAMGSLGWFLADEARKNKNIYDLVFYLAGSFMMLFCLLLLK